MPTRTQATKRPAAGRFGRPASARRPTIVTRRTPQRSGAANVAGKIGGLLPGMQAKKPRRGAAGGRVKKGAAGFALLAGAAGLVMKHRDKLTSIVRHSDTSTEAPAPAGPVPSTSVRPETPEAGAGPWASADRPTT
jgi:hypothetical protein